MKFASVRIGFTYVKSLPGYPAKSPTPSFVGSLVAGCRHSHYPRQLVRPLHQSSPHHHPQLPIYILTWYQYCCRTSPLHTTSVSVTLVSRLLLNTYTLSAPSNSAYTETETGPVVFRTPISRTGAHRTRNVSWSLGSTFVEESGMEGEEGVIEMAPLGSGSIVEEQRV